MTDLVFSDIGSASTAASASFITVADLRQATRAWPDLVLAGDASTAETDDNVTQAITAASSLIARYTGEEFSNGSTAATHIVDGPPTDVYKKTSRTLLLNRRFWQGSVTLVESRDDNGTWSSYSATDYRVYGSLNSTGTDYQVGDPVDCIKMISDTANWDSGVLNIRVTAKWGWASPPWPIKRATALIVYDWLSGKNAGLHRAISWQTSNASYQQAVDAIMGIPEVEQLLSQYHFGGLQVAII